MIGIVGGVGPRAGLDVFEKIIEETPAEKDQDHLPVLLHSIPGKITDRTAFLLGKESTNPGYVLAHIILELERSGAKVVGIPCNTAHAEPIFSVIKEELLKRRSTVQVLHMITEVVDLICRKLPDTNIGVLCTNGTKLSRVYKSTFEQRQVKIVEPDELWQERIHAAIYNEEYGIKANSSRVTEKALNELQGALAHLREKGAGAFVLGCTELPLALTKENYEGLPLIDANRVLAKSLIREYLKNNQPDKL